MRIVVVLASALAFLAAGPAAADAPNVTTITGEASDGRIEIDGRADSPGSDATGARRGRRRVVAYVPACPGNSPGVSDAVLCQSAIALCAGTPEPTDVLFWRFTAVRAADGSTGPWTPAGQACLRPQDVPAAAVPAFTVADFRRLPLPRSVLHVQPGNGQTLVAVPTNLYATAAPATFDVTLLGLPVRVRAVPTAWTWSYGDGSRRTWTAPGGPYPDLSTAHTYTQPGRYPVTVTTTWTGTYSVAGGPPVPVDGTATTDTPPVTVTAVATRAELVADPLT